MPGPIRSLRAALALCGAIALGPAACEEDAPSAPPGPGGFQRAPAPVHSDAALAPDAAAGEADAGGGGAQVQSAETAAERRRAAKK